MQTFFENQFADTVYSMSAEEAKVNTITGAQMPSQLWVGKATPEEKDFKEIIDSGWPKPYGGMWSSTERLDGESEWTRFLREQFPESAEGKNVVCQLTPKASARIAVIDSWEDFTALREKYPPKKPAGGTEKESAALFWGPRFCFEDMAKDFDALWVTDEGLVDQIRRNWDIESALWLNWAIEKVEIVRSDWVVSENVRPGRELEYHETAYLRRLAEEALETENQITKIPEAGNTSKRQRRTSPRRKREATRGVIKAEQ